MIEWFDAHDLPDKWMEKGAVRVDIRLVQTVGFLLDADSAGHTVIASSDDGDDNVAGGIIIPNVNVTQRKRLK